MSCDLIKLVRHAFPGTSQCHGLRPGRRAGNASVLKSRSKYVTIVDGDHVKNDYWFLMPEKNPDIYYVELPMKPHTVTFRTDIDTISFPVEFGNQHDFVIVLNEATVCPTQVRTVFRKLQPYTPRVPIAMVSSTRFPSVSETTTRSTSPVASTAAKNFNSSSTSGVVEASLKKPLSPTRI